MCVSSHMPQEAQAFRKCARSYANTANMEITSFNTHPLIGLELHSSKSFDDCLLSQISQNEIFPSQSNSLLD